MGASESKQLQRKIETEIGYQFQNSDLFVQAMTHDSMRVQDPNIPTYQRLEFLGDSVLQFVITNYVYHLYPNSQEGDLSFERTQLICGNKQKVIADKLELKKYVKLAVSVRSQPASSSMKRYDKFVESIIGAVYLDAGEEENGLRVAKKVIYKLWGLTDPVGSGCIIS